MSDHTDNPRIVAVGEETNPDEGWFECWDCGINAGFTDFAAAQLAADAHNDFDCEREWEVPL